MKTFLSLLVFSIFAFNATAQQKPISLEKYLTTFDYSTPGQMSVKANEAKDLIMTKKATLLDIRFNEEVATWKVNTGLHIPLNELPKRLNELDKNTMYIAACPHDTRSELAMIYLTTQGYNVKFLMGGLIELMETLRGGSALEFQNAMKK